MTMTARGTWMQLTVAAATLCGGGGRDARADPTVGKPAILVELFSSEGCSSCPPADRLLARLDGERRAEGAQRLELAALELHVDYWNRLGWIDPFSSAAFSERQSRYASAFGRDGVYTPQMVVDGQVELNGSDEARARAAIAAASRRPRLPIELVVDGDRVAVRVGTGGVTCPTGGAEVWLALTESGLATDVPSGENAGATLAHGPIVRTLRRLGTVGAGDSLDARGFSSSVRLPEDAAHRGGPLRVVAFVADARTRHVLGAAIAGFYRR